MLSGTAILMNMNCFINSRRSAHIFLSILQYQTMISIFLTSNNFDYLLFPWLSDFMYSPRISHLQNPPFCPGSPQHSFISEKRLPLKGSSSSSIKSAMCFRLSKCQPAGLDMSSPAANKLGFRISRCQPTCLDLPSPADNSLVSGFRGVNPLA